MGVRAACHRWRRRREGIWTECPCCTRCCTWVLLRHPRAKISAAAPNRKSGLTKHGQGRRHCRGHVPRGVRDAGGVLPESGEGVRGGGGARRARVPGLSALALEATAHQQRTGARQTRYKAQVEGCAGLPVGEFAAQARGRRHVRPGRDMVRLAPLLGEEGGRDARRGAPEGCVGLS